jgi:uncharacterized membrane protein (UPF0127 family)
LIIRNTRTGTVISSEAGVASSFLSRAIGLMLSQPRDLILISPREDIESSSIHMMFMRYTIDVIWLDANKQVDEVRKNIPAFNILKQSTWRIYRPKKAAKYVIELGKNRLITAQEPLEDDLTVFSAP